MKTHYRNFLPHEIEYQFGCRNRNTNHRRSINIERFWNDRLIGKLTAHKNDVFCLEDECDAYAYAVQFCPKKVTLKNPIDFKTFNFCDFRDLRSISLLPMRVAMSTSMTARNDLKTRPL